MSRATRLRAWVAVGLALAGGTVAGLAGCHGQIGAETGRPPPDASPPPGEGALPGPAAPRFACDPAAAPADLPLPRLSRTELESTYRAAVARALPADAEAIWTAVAATFAQYPVDRRTPAPGDLKGGYSRGDQAIEQTQVDASYAVATAIARELTGSSDRLGRLLGGCATDASTSNDRTCLEAFVRGWGARVMRYALPEDDLAYFADIGGATPVDAAAVSDVIATILASPRTLYRVESGTGSDGALAPLGAYELAARLSYQFWQAPPDDELWAAAESGALLTASGYAAALDRVLAAPQLARSLDDFVTEWLRLDELPSLEALRDDPVYRAFAGSPLPTDATRQAMLDDVRTSLRQTVAEGRSVRDFFTDTRSYTSDAYLASVYQVAPWLGAGAQPVFPSANRAGLLGRAALLAAGTAATRPIHRGYLIRNALLCEQVGAPPPNAATKPPAPTAALTTREAVTQLTSGGSCGACHDTLINPQGFVLEGFDALGRERIEERLFDADGNVTSTRAVDTTATVLIDGHTFVARSTAELARLIDASRLFPSCLARHYFRFSQRRPESPAGDGCLLAALETAARADAPLSEVLKANGDDPLFKTRRFR